MIHINLTKTLCTEAVACSTVTQYFYMMSFTDSKDLKVIHSRPNSFSEIDGASLKVLVIEQFSSLRDLIRHTYLSRITIQ
jgi:hypothetical protein